MSLRRNALWNLAGNGLPLVAAVALIPYTLQQLGNEAFGVLTLIWALIGYFSLFDMGIGRALTYELSKLHASGELLEIAPTLKAGLIITFLAGFFGAIAMLALSPLMVENWLKITAERQQDAKLSFQLAALGILPTTIASGLRGALEGLGGFAKSNINKIFLGFCMFSLPALSIKLHGNSLWIIALYLVVARIVVAIISALHLRLYLFQPTEGMIFKNLKPLINYGVWVTVSGIIGPLMIYGDRFFVSAAVGAAQLSLYAIPQEGLQRLLIIPAALCSALLPKLSALKGQLAIDLYHRSYMLITVIMFAICTTVAFLIYPFLGWWISETFAQQAIVIALILTLGIFINAVSSVPYTLIHANGNPRLTALIHIFELFLYMVVLCILASMFGLVGAAIAWVGRVFLDFALLNYAARQTLKGLHETK